MNNERFLEYMQNLLGERYELFKAAYFDKPRFKALRVNTLKISVPEFLKLFPHAERYNILCKQSLYCDVKPSLDPLYHAGLYYMQEPSASAAVAAFEPFITGNVLDLCSAPGGKATQAAQVMHGAGLIFCNDPEYKRTRAIVENVERLGVTDAVITCNTAADYVRAGFSGYFDTLMVDAPCSGGGITRYEDVPYSKEIVAGCALRQREILRDAVELLRVGGYMLYSTCTFAKEENEDNIAFLRELGMRTVDIPLRQGEERGIGEKDARRVYPFAFDGEGHFYCVLEKVRGGAGADKKPLMRKKRECIKLNGLKLDANVLCGKYTVLPIEPPELDGLNIIRVGTPVFGEGREISHALMHALDKEQMRAFGTAELGDAAHDYICGRQLKFDAPKGELIATVNGYALGLARSAASGDGERALKNKYPKALRIPQERSF